MVSSHMCPCLLSLQDLDLEAGSASGKIIRQEYIKVKLCTLTRRPRTAQFLSCEHLCR